MSGVWARALRLLLCSAPVVLSAEQTQREGAHAAINPIRKVVNMLQKMQAQVTAEGKKEEELFEKFMCYCKNNGGDLENQIDNSKTKIGSLGSSLKESTEKKSQTKADLKQHQVDRTEAEDAMSKAKTLREKEAKEFAKFSADATANIDATKKAVAAIESGMAGAFLQTKAASSLRTFTMEKAELPDDSRKDVLAFLSGSDSQGYAPQGGQITGILKTMLDEMSQTLADATATEEQSIQTYDELTTAKKKQVETLTVQIETKQKRIGELGVSIATMKNDLDDTEESLEQDTKFLQELKTSCKTKEKEWDDIKAMRAQELAAIAETIKVLNDDDALELFKKTLPSASASLLQLHQGTSTVKAKALDALKRAAERHLRALRLPARPEINLIALALRGKKIGLAKVIGMIDEMIANLKTEQDDDDHKKEYCEKQIDMTEDKNKELDRALKDSEAAIEEMKGNIVELTEEIKELEAGVKKLDKQVADATDQRKKDSAENEALVAANSAAKELLLMAKNRLYKFYNPKMYKPPAAEEIQIEEAAASFVQISSHRGSRQEVAPPPPPETFGAYTKKSEDSGGVIAMVDLLIADLEKEITEAKTTEKVDQEDYEEMLDQAAKKRADDSKSMTDKQSAKASNEEALEVEEDNKKGTTKELFATLEYLQSLHGECDWLLTNYANRKAARADEVSALGQAKDVLNGADLSLVQTRSASKVHGFLERK
mmetsp:Transcript_107896/g.348260  ORF Transcript_107896/g.348260 Transcript_107896/m.348260 type:complete len:717 (-) Transcript_107896:87-2237(-)